MAEFVNDTFTDSNQRLEQHTPDLGGVWEQVFVEPWGTLARFFDANILNNHLLGVKASRSGSPEASSLYRNSQDPGTNEYDVKFTMQTVNSHAADQGWFVLAARMDPTGTDNNVDRYLGRYEHGTSGSRKFELAKVISGVETILDTVNESLSSGSSDLKLEIRDAAKKVFLDDVEKLTSADDAITQDGRAGVGAASDNASSIDFIDNFIAETAAAGVPIKIGGLPLTGTSVMALVSPLTIILGQLPLAGTGVMLATGAPAVVGQLPLSGTGSMATAPLILTLGSLSLSGSGSMVPSGTNILLAVLPLAGAGAMSPDGHNIAFAVLPLSGVATIAMVGQVIPIGAPPVNEGALNLSGAGVMAMAERLIVHGVLPLAGTSVLLPTGENIIIGGLPLSGGGIMLPTELNLIHGLLELAGAGMMLPTGHTILLGVAPLAGTGSMSSEGEVVGDWQDFGEIKRLIVSSASDVYKFTVVAKSIDGVQRTEVRFFNIDDDQVVANTTMFTISAASVILTSPVLVLTGSKEYKAQMKGSGT